MRLVHIKMIRNNQFWHGCGEKGSPCLLLVGKVTVLASKKLGIELPVTQQFLF